MRSDALSEEQQEILAKRGVLSPEAIHRLASKTKVAVADGGAKASCHSDYVDPEEAKQVQRDRLVRLNTAPAHNVPTHDSLI